MHKFTRGEPPEDMAKTKKKYRNQWDETFLKSDEHTAISNCLYERQNHYCAYCDVKISTQDAGHVEHLERRSDNPRRTFDWKNLFFSCNHTDSCGKYKDEHKPKIEFNPADIIDPSKEDPLDFLQFDMNGGVSAKDDAPRHRADETIRVFNLKKDARLKRLRSNIAIIVSSFLESEPEPSKEKIDEFLREVADSDCPSVYYSLLKRKMV